MTGRCVCKPGIQGQKCTVCSNHEHTLGPNGCFDRGYTFDTDGTGLSLDFYSNLITILNIYFLQRNPPNYQLPTVNV